MTQEAFHGALDTLATNAVAKAVELNVPVHYLLLSRHEEIACVPQAKTTYPSSSPCWLKR